MPDDLTFDRINPYHPKHRLLAIRDRDAKIYRATLGDANAVIEPNGDTLRIPWVQAGDDVRMRDLLDAVGMDSKRSRRIRFVCVATDDPEDRAYRAALSQMGVPVDGPSIPDVVHGGERVDEEWSPDTHDVAERGSAGRKTSSSDVDESQTVPCYETVWSIDDRHDTE